MKLLAVDSLLFSTLPCLALLGVIVVFRETAPGTETSYSRGRQSFFQHAFMAKLFFFPLILFLYLFSFFVS